MPRSSCTTVVARPASSSMRPMARAVGLAPATAAALTWPRYLEVVPTASSWRRHPLWKASATT
uniref:Macaca fascicularis brain cDNA clone: QflA-10302, similar to human transducer of ERBB2, 2 (TOB2), mRNA, RefSeq: NM_016272.2 n=1 Tax=Macaca fascicularis TaxID=9541 RepID=I7GHS0_MACFA|nr:unnamed protein product [Macaca fascicularis]